MFQRLRLYFDKLHSVYLVEHLIVKIKKFGFDQKEESDSDYQTYYLNKELLNSTF